MAIFYYTKQMFPHTYVEINDYSEVKLPSSPLDNTNRQLSPVFADMGPDDRIMVVTMDLNLLSFMENKHSNVMVL